MISREKIEEAKAFIKNNARSVDLAIYQYFYENGTKQKVIEELAKYQNPDGGFGHGLEADNWNPNSNPIATNDAIITLYRVNALEETNEMIAAIVSYLQSHDSFNEEQQKWLFAIETNKDYPHAIWWEKEKDGINGFNPTVSLAAFLVCYGERDAKNEEIIRNAFAYLREAEENSADGLKCYLLCYELLKIHKIEDIVNLNEVKELLMEKIQSTICKDVEKYGKEYVSLPSDIFTGIFKEFINEEIRGLIQAEKDVLGSLQKEDGGFDICWQWYNDYEEFAQARDMWRPRVTLDKVLFLEG